MFPDNFASFGGHGRTVFHFGGFRKASSGVRSRVNLGFFEPWGSHILSTSRGYHRQWTHFITIPNGHVWWWLQQSTVVTVKIPVLKQMFSCSYLVQFSRYVFYCSNKQLHLRWLLAVVGSPVVAGGGIVFTPTGKAASRKACWDCFFLNRQLESKS